MRLVHSSITASILFALSATSAFAATHVVLVGPNSNLVFSPSTITIPPGDTITFQQTDTTITHNAVSDDGTTFSSGAAKVGPWTYETPALAAGTYTYECTVHGGIGMTGTINVQLTPVRLQSFDVK